MMTAYRVKIIDLVSMGQREQVEKLISSGCNINEQTDMGHSAVLEAINRNDLQILKLLIKAKANVEAKNTFGHTPLSRAIKIGNKEIIDLIQNRLTLNNLPEKEKSYIKGAAAGFLSHKKIPLSVGKIVGSFLDRTSGGRLAKTSKKSSGTAKTERDPTSSFQYSINNVQQPCCHSCRNNKLSPLI